MNRRLSSVLGIAVLAGGFGALLQLGGCSSSDPAPNGPVDSGGGGGDGGGGGACPSKAADPNAPPVGCPRPAEIPACKSTTEVASCPSDNGCMAVTKQSGDVLNMRMGRIQLWAPDALAALTSLAVDPNVNPVCMNNGNETFNWLLQIDRKANTLKTGGARKSADHKTFAFSTEKVNAKDLSGICPGFAGSDTPIDLSPITVPIHFTGNTFTSDVLPHVSIPIFDTSPTNPPIVLPLSDGIIKSVTISADGNCIGGWDKNFWCDGDSLGWTTGGVLLGKMTVEDADKVPVKSAGCQSLCAILANDSTKTSKGVCKRGADGKIPNIGDSSVGGVPNNAFLLSSTFSAYGVTITSAEPPPPDAGPSDTGTGDAADGG